MHIEHLSVSRYGTNKECQQLYKYKYHLKIPSPEPTPDYFDYGKIIHKIIETYTLGRGQTNINTIIQSVLKGDIELEPGKKAPPLSLDYKKKLPEHCRQFMRLSDKIGTEGYVEWGFDYDLQPPHKKKLVGFIDRIIIKGKQYFLIDYKTTKKGQWRQTRQSITTDLQLQTYCRIVQKTFGAEAKNIYAALFYLEGGETLGASFSEKTLDEVEAKLLTCYDSIKEADPDQVHGNVGWHCKRCVYRKMCPFYSLT